MKPVDWKLLMTSFKSIYKIQFGPSVFSWSHVRQIEHLNGGHIGVSI